MPSIFTRHRFSLYSFFSLMAMISSSITYITGALDNTLSVPYDQIRGPLGFSSYAAHGRQWQTTVKARFGAIIHCLKPLWRFHRNNVTQHSCLPGSAKQCVRNVSLSPSFESCLLYNLESWALHHESAINFTKQCSTRLLNDVDTGPAMISEIRIVLAARILKDQVQAD